MPSTTRPAQPDLIVVGDVMVDVTARAEDLAPGGDVHGEVRLRPAGAGANAAVWAAARGATVRLLGRVGADVAGRLVAEALHERGVEPALTVDPAARTGVMLVLTQAGERSMVADRGANAGLVAGDLPGRLEARAVLVSGYLLFDPGSEQAARAALDRSAARWIAVEAASWPLLEAYGRERFLDATRGANVLLANEREAGVLAPGAPSPDEAARALAADYDLVCVKAGASGAVAAAGGELLRTPSPEVREADPTGAGDAFDGVLLTELASGAGLAAALREACRAGAAAAASPGSWPPS